ncbi:MAG: type IV secretion system DNA-binding domain-containing protein [Coriobacteriia bacterium]|nr:type IV secretion system DNA-binding domain-containing protein [Coriobacteriia bacterium]
MPWKTEPLSWLEIFWPRPLEEKKVLELLTHLATLARRGQIVFEVRCAKARVRYVLGAHDSVLWRLKALLQGLCSELRFAGKVKRADMIAAKSIKLSSKGLATNTHNQEALVRAILAALAQTRATGAETVLQIVLGASFAPSMLAAKPANPSATWLDYLRGSVPPPSSESISLQKDRVAHHGFALAMRIGALAKEGACPSPTKAQSQMRAVFCALKVAESAGVRLRAATDKPQNLNLATCPWFYPMRLSVRELAGFLAWPIGDTELPGTASLNPKILFLPTWYKAETRSFGLSSGFAGKRLCLGISARDSLEHTVLLGPTGAGKSTAMLNLILADIEAERSVLVIDPKHTLVGDILERIPDKRKDEVVVIDPTDTRPVGFNPLADRTQHPSLVADGVLTVLHDVFADFWGIRTQDILSAALLTLVHYGQAHGGNTSLVWLPALLTDAQFRHKIVSKVAAIDPLGIGAFWAGFEALSQAEKNQHIAPVLNKIRQFLLRPQLRAVLGQSKPQFSLNDLFDKRRIVLVPLNKGIIGKEAARLLGSFIVMQLWTLALGRANKSPEQLHIVNAYIDEVQDYLSLPTDLADALSQARGLGVGLTLAHQYRAQLPPALRAGIDTNARNKIVFGLGATDAREMAAMAKAEGLSALDFELLPRFGVYASLQQGGRATGWISGSTKPAPPTTSLGVEIKALSQARFGQDAKLIEQEFLELMGYTRAHAKTGGLQANATQASEAQASGVQPGKAQDTPIGRKMRGRDDADT